MLVILFSILASFLLTNYTGIESPSLEGSLEERVPQRLVQSIWLQKVILLLEERFGCLFLLNNLLISGKIMEDRAIIRSMLTIPIVDTRHQQGGEDGEGECQFTYDRWRSNIRRRKSCAKVYM
ncbi:hypothetical protein J1N35_028335 [Gossypium stocksii]|uniref:Uncharacterized protein n=1 Tax=Gossypium stocksii TaxID=47602 RepID=A0A9D3UVZ5_9ROSI|nr:hypothetical protein J1N35_028335 [Gossypium stocksii]